MESAWEAWQKDNRITTVDPNRDSIYKYNHKGQKHVIEEVKPWKKNPEQFKNVRISAVALMKMVMHARSGGSIEVMGIMLGGIHGDTFIITDAFRLPVEGTETRVNAQDEANEYQVNYLEKLRQAGRDEVPVGWYHSHPGYGCWLSGIDVKTQELQQAYQEPSVAVVIDPERTMSSGKVEIGAFRTYPEEYKSTSSTSGDRAQAIPLEKSQEFGAHADRYYSLEVSYFKSTMDIQLLSTLWNRYWVDTLSSKSLIAHRDYSTKEIKDLAAKISETAKSQSSDSRSQANGQSSRKLGTESDATLDKLAKSSQKISTQQQLGLDSEFLKDRLFRA